MPSRLSIRDKWSAFTYWEDDSPSRMDFGKIKYGGPFTTVQVEDVKTLIKTLEIILVICFIHCVYGIQLS